MKMTHPGSIKLTLLFEQRINPNPSPNPSLSSITLVRNGQWLAISIVDSADPNQDIVTDNTFERLVNHRLVWDVRNRKEIYRIPQSDDYESYRRGYAILDGTRYSLCDIDGKPHVFHLGEPWNELRCNLPGSGTQNSFFSPDGRFYSMFDKFDYDYLHVWDARMETQLGKRKIIKHREWMGRWLVFSPDGARMCVCDDYVWNVLGDVCAELEGIEEIQNFSCEHVPCFSADGKFLAETRGGYIHVWDTDSFHRLAKVHVQNDLNLILAHSPQSFYVFTDWRNSVFALWLDDWRITPIEFPKSYPDASQRLLGVQHVDYRWFEEMVFLDDGRTAITRDRNNFLSYWKIDPT